MMYNNICDQLNLYLEKIFTYFYCNRLKKSKKVTPSYYFERDWTFLGDKMEKGIREKQIEDLYRNGYPNGFGKRRF